LPPVSATASKAVTPTPVRRRSPRFKNSSFRVDPSLGIFASLERHTSLLTVEEIAPALAVSAKAVYGMVARGTLPVVRLGQLLRFDPKAVAIWLSRRTAEVAH